MLGLCFSDFARHSQSELLPAAALCAQKSTAVRGQLEETSKETYLKGPLCRVTWDFVTLHKGVI